MPFPRSIPQDNQVYLVIGLELWGARSLIFKNIK